MRRKDLNVAVLFLLTILDYKTVCTRTLFEIFHIYHRDNGIKEGGARVENEDLSLWAALEAE